MGLEAIGYHVRELHVVGDRGERLAGFRRRQPSPLAGGRFIAVPCSRLSRLLFYSAARRSAYRWLRGKVRRWRRDTVQNEAHSLHEFANSSREKIA